jgi:hypothetical protein
MRSIIPESAHPALGAPGIYPYERADRLADTTFDQMKTALAFLSTFYPDEFDHAMDVSLPKGQQADISREAEPRRCATCGASIGVFLRLGLAWQHFTGDGTTAGQQQIYDPGHVPVVSWVTPNN